MRAKLLIREKITDEHGDLREWVVWLVSYSVLYPQGVRYRMAFIPRNHRNPVVLYDNHHPKGHHKHINGKQLDYSYSSVKQLRTDFEMDVEKWIKAGRFLA
ncbi:MAG: hypothetical protein HY610_03580 [Elusimicrobia bacterium]|nr:hypothetical protein [Elusimicrobiota bacterium]